MRVSAEVRKLFIYPVKSCKPIALREIAVGDLLHA